MGKIIRIVLTGGPCAGKSTMVNKLMSDLQFKGYIVLCVNESATEVEEMGLRYKFINNCMEYQKLILSSQIQKNQMVNYIANKKNDHNYIILYDRAVLDNKAYMNNYQDFNFLMDTFNLSELECMDQYDLIVDLISAAACDLSKYNLNNKARRETPEEAIALDKKTSNAWVGHNNIFISNSNIDWDEEYKLVKKRIEDLLNGNEKKEIKTYLINNVYDDFYKYDDNNSREIEVEETLLNVPNENNLDYKIYKKKYKDSVTYLLEVTKVENGILKKYFNQKLSYEEYNDEILRYGIKNLVSYKQLSFIENKQMYNFKFFNDDIIMEIEENKLNSHLNIPSVVYISAQLENKEVEDIYIKNNLLKVKKYDRIN